MFAKAKFSYFNLTKKIIYTYNKASYERLSPKQVMINNYTQKWV